MAKTTENFGSDRQGAESRASEHRSSGKDSHVTEKGHDNGAGKWETDQIVVTEDGK